MDSGLDQGSVVALVALLSIGFIHQSAYSALGWKTHLTKQPQLTSYPKGGSVAG